jgi:hypothetical protein
MRTIQASRGSLGEGARDRYGRSHGLRATRPSSFTQPKIRRKRLDSGRGGSFSLLLLWAQNKSRTKSLQQASIPSYALAMEVEPWDHPAARRVRAGRATEVGGNNSTRRPLFVSGDECEVGGIEGGNVGLRLSTAEIDALLPALELVIRLSPTEARKVAAALIRWSDVMENAGEP